MARPRPKKTKIPAANVRVIKIIDKLNRAHPEAKLDLSFSNPVELLIALILAAQARDDLVNQVTGWLFRSHRRAEDYASTPPSKLEEEIRRINFFRNKARLIQNCCRELVERFHGKVPDNLDDLLTLPGVGRKTGNIVTNYFLAC